MIVRLYVVYDRVAQESGPIFEAKNDGVAGRNFREFLKKVDTPAVEFQLLCVGSFDNATNKIEASWPAREVTENALQQG